MVGFSVLRRGLAWVVLIAAAMLGVAAAPALAQSGDKIPVIVMGEDSDPLSIPRSSDVFRRVLLALQEKMSDYGFYVIDEDILTARLGWISRDHRPKQELMEVAVLANQASDVRLHTRAIILFKIRAAAMEARVATRIQVRITGEIHDVVANRFITAWSAPARRYAAAPHCSGYCIEEILGDKAEEMAGEVGAILSVRLDFLTGGRSPQ